MVQTGKPRENLDSWEKAIEYGNIAQCMFRDGERKRKDGPIQQTNTDTLLRYNFSIIGCLVTRFSF